MRKKFEITTHEAKTHLSKYLALVAEGAEVVIKKGAVPVASLVYLANTNKKTERPKVGTVTSEKVTYTKDCFDSLTQAELDEWGV